MLEPYAMKVARTVPRGGKFSNEPTYLNRPYAALLLHNCGVCLDILLVVKGN
jgi:hypothetical protein